MMDVSDAQIRRETSGWFHEDNKPNWLHRQIISVLKCGEVPKHIAIIMDGNRRYAKKEHIERQQGHMKGFNKLSETLEWCLDLGINEVTVYAFSIENFKRSEDEVGGLMALLRVKLQDLIDDRPKLEENGVCIRVLGNISLLPNDVQVLIAEVVSMSSSFTRSFLNLCLAYTSREEITSSIKQVADGLAKGDLQESDVDAGLLESCLYSAPCQPVDLLLRTSGEVRLSDFLLWQSTYTLLSFVHVLWPEFSRWDLYGAVLFYQKHQGTLREIKEGHDAMTPSITDVKLDEESVKRKQEFLNGLHKKNVQHLKDILAK